MREGSIIEQHASGAIGIAANISVRRKLRQLLAGQSLARFAGASMAAVGVGLVVLCLAQPPNPQRNGA